MALSRQLKYQSALENLCNLSPKSSKTELVALKVRESVWYLNELDASVLSICVIIYFHTLTVLSGLQSHHISHHDDSRWPLPWSRCLVEACLRWQEYKQNVGALNESGSDVYLSILHTGKHGENVLGTLDPAVKSQANSSPTVMQR